MCFVCLIIPCEESGCFATILLVCVLRPASIACTIGVPNSIGISFGLFILVVLLRLILKAMRKILFVFAAATALYSCKSDEVVPEDPISGRIYNRTYGPDSSILSITITFVNDTIVERAGYRINRGDTFVSEVFVGSYKIDQDPTDIIADYDIYSTLHREFYRMFDDSLQYRTNPTMEAYQKFIRLR